MYVKCVVVVVIKKEGGERQRQKEEKKESNARKLVSKYKNKDRALFYNKNLNIK